MRAWRWAMAGGLGLLLAACGQDPARSVKIVSRQAAPVTAAYTPPRPVEIVSRPPAPVTAAYTPPRGPDRNLIPEFCPPPPDSGGPGSFVAKGPCEFEQRAPVACEAAGDDFIVAVPRTAKNGAMLVIYLNVEHYHGPGVYDAAQLSVAVESGETIYRWSNDDVHATVGAHEAFVTLPRTPLDQEPMHVACSRLIGPESNYTYQCAGSSSLNLAIDSAAEMVSGKLPCRGPRH